MLTVADVLEMPVVRNAEPEIVAGRKRCDRVVQWVHSTELPDIGPLLRGGDLILTTGIAMPEKGEDLQSFARSLEASQAAGLLVELGRRWKDLPPPLVETCEELGLPLIVLRREVRFAAITQAIGERIVDARVAELREAQRVHETFTNLSIDEAGPKQILSATQRLAGNAVTLESEDHRILDFRAGPEDPAAFLDDWERRSRLVRPSSRTFWDESNGWLVAPIGKRERGWGRLLLECKQPPSERLIAVIERAAAALAMYRLHDRHRDTHVRRRDHELLVSLLAEGAVPAVVQRWQLAGFPTEGRRYLGLAVRRSAPRRDSHPEARGAAVGLKGRSLTPSHDDLVHACLRAAEKTNTPAVVAAIGDDVRVLLAGSGSESGIDKAEKFARAVKDRVSADVAAGAGASTFADADRSLHEARHVLSAINQTASDAVLHRLADVHLRGLLMLLADDDRVQTFMRRELAPLRGLDTKSSSTLMRTLAALVDASGNKQEVASQLQISRPVVYDRISRIESVMKVDLSNAETMTSIHVALLLDEIAHLRQAHTSVETSPLGSAGPA